MFVEDISCIFFSFEIEQTYTLTTFVDHKLSLLIAVTLKFELK